MDALSPLEWVNGCKVVNGCAAVVSGTKQDGNTKSYIMLGTSVVTERLL